MNDIKLSTTTVRILGAYKRNGFYSGTICGARGIGKSSYAIQVLYQVYRQLGFEKDEAWEMALDRIMYKITDIIKFLDDSVHSKEHEVAFIWDDAGVFGSGTRWFSHHEEMHLLQNLMDTIRGAVSGILLTCPDMMQLARFLRRYDDYLIKITYADKGDGYRLAKCYVKRITPAMQTRVYTQYHDNYNVYLPKWVYEKYCEKRESYNLENIEEMKRLQLAKVKTKESKKKP